MRMAVPCCADDSSFVFFVRLSRAPAETLYKPAGGARWNKRQFAANDWFPSMFFEV